MNASIAAPPPATMTGELSPAQFESVRELLHRQSGITLRDGKQALVKARLTKRLRDLKLHSFDDYMDYLDRDNSGTEIAALVDVLTTNKTSFFRETPHFDFLRDRLIPEWKARKGPVRLWSAGCSSGEEPFSVGILLREEVPDIDRRDVRILATDISPSVLGIAHLAIYPEQTVSSIPAPLLKKYFTCVESRPPRCYKVKDCVRSMVRLARLNLMEPWPMKGPFDVISCRNVMIYFDTPTRQALVRRYRELLCPGGHLFLGHSETLSGSDHGLQYVQPAVYVK